ncbi:MAG: FtsX-like permease family protein, partial [Actinomycetota bacterium]|nr:FtsX-like permease family protein [Actinomycetota bacterium]
MFTLIWGAVRTRTAQVLTVLVLTALAAAVAAAGPWFAYASMNRAATADVTAAPAEQRLLSVRQIADTEGDPRAAIDDLTSRVQGQLPLPQADPVTGLALPLTARVGGGNPSMNLAFREDFCAHVELEGACPASPGEAAISVAAAQRLGLRIGDLLPLRASLASAPIVLTVVATFTYHDSDGAYWGNSLFEANGGSLDPAFTPIATFQREQLGEPTVTFDLTVPDALLRGEDGFRLGPVLREAEASLAASGLRLVNATGPLLEAIERNRHEIRVGVVVAMAQTLVLTWFAVGLAGHYTGRDRRGDAALLKLRGSTRSATLRLAWGQHLVPLAAGALIGLPFGYLLGRWLAGPVATVAEQRAALLLSVTAVAAVLLGGLVVLAVVEAVALRRPVADLLREVGSGRGDWRGGLADLLLLVIAVAAVYQARSSAPDSGLALAAPGLVALAVALLVARLLGRVASHGGGRAMRSGHLRLGLTSVQVSRQPGSERVFAFVVVAVALFATTLGLALGDNRARTERSEAELGAERVLTVRTPTRTTLLHAVRRADPEGDQAMAVVVDRHSIPPVLAVDSSRLARVATWRPVYGPPGLLAAATAEDPGPDPTPAVTGERLTLRLRNDSREPVALGLSLQHEGTGEAVQVRFGTLRRGEQSLTAPVTGCRAAPGCRILRWQFSAPVDANGNVPPPPAGSAVTLRELTQQGPAAGILGRSRLGDIARWRSDTDVAALDIATVDGGLRIASDENGFGSPDAGIHVYAVDSAMPPPVVLAGPPPGEWRFQEPSMSSLGDRPVPVRVDGTARVLPALGPRGLLVDLETSRRIAGDADVPGEFEVWLAPGAGLGVVDELRAAGLVVTGEDTVARRSSRLAEQGPAAIARFGLLGGVVGLLLAAATLAVAGAVDRRRRLEHLRALRLQGLPLSAAVGTAYAGAWVLIVAGVVVGLVAAVIADPLARVAVRGFTDGWDVLPLPGALGWPAVG